jgi:hypothetical protein
MSNKTAYTDFGRGECRPGDVIGEGSGETLIVYAVDPD